MITGMIGRALALALLAAVGMTAAWQGAVALQKSDDDKPKAEKAKDDKKEGKKSDDKADKKDDKKEDEKAEAPKPVEPRPATSASTSTAQLTARPKPKVQQNLPPTDKSTPMEQRVATIGLLNKRNGLWRDLTMKPGESIRVGDVVIRLRACETTAPWEPEQLTGAFVQVITRSPDNSWKKAFSGWVFKESPSLNVVEHPIYDVWTKDCQMRHPDMGPDTTRAVGGETASSSAEKSESRRSRARSSDDE
jgi:hypothetical protein